MGANLTRHFLMRSKIKVRVIYFSVIEQVEPQSHVGEKTVHDSLVTTSTSFTVLVLKRKAVTPW